MKKIIVTLCAFALVGIGFLSSALFTQKNSYNNFTHKILCDSKRVCYHEAAHKYDYEHGKISKTNEWKNDVTVFRQAIYVMPSKDYKTDELMYYIEFFPGIGTDRIKYGNIFTSSFWEGGWGGYTELYAVISEYSEGDINKIPLMLQKYYDMEEINNTMKGLGY